MAVSGDADADILDLLFDSNGGVPI